MAYGKLLRIAVQTGAALALLGFGLGLGPAPGHAQQVRISDLTDVAFGTISNFTTDLTRRQDVCAHSTAAGNRYSVTASGSGAGGSLDLQSGSGTLAYEVQWAGATGQTVGTNLVANVAQGGFSEVGSSATCKSGIMTASLITILRSTAISAATAGAYTGTLTLILAPN